MGDLWRSLAERLHVTPLRLLITVASVVGTVVVALFAIFMTLSYTWDTSKCYQAKFHDDIVVVGNIKTTTLPLRETWEDDQNISVTWDADALELSVDAPEHWLWSSVSGMAFVYVSWGPITYSNRDGQYYIKDKVDKLVTMQTVDSMVRDKNGTVTITGKLMRDLFLSNTYEVRIRYLLPFSLPPLFLATIRSGVGI